MPEVLETKRLTLRPFEAADADTTFTWFMHPEVMRFTPSGPDLTADAVKARVQRYIDHQSKHGFSKWVIHDRVTQRAIGDAGLFMMPDLQRVELGYRFAHEHWGLGLATEVASGWLQVAAPWFNITRVFAFTHAENTASQHVLEKVGFRYSHRETLYAMDAPVYVRDLVSG